MFYSCEKSILRKKSGSPLRNFHLLCFLGIWESYNTLLSNFLSIICQVVTYGRLQTKENFKRLALKVVAVAYERWSLTRGSQCSDLTGKLLIFWKTGRRGEVVATGGSTVIRFQNRNFRNWKRLRDCLHFALSMLSLPQQIVILKTTIKTKLPKRNKKLFVNISLTIRELQVWYVYCTVHT